VKREKNSEKNGQKEKKRLKKKTRIHENEREKKLKLLSSSSYTRLRVMNAMIFIIAIKHARVNIRLPYFSSIWRHPISPMISTIPIDNF
jgi:hypothetical protein